ncbi:MAG TPA: GntR family transcriptional regulator [Thermoguttaceae bacterium]|nr:GntR family transcriptional regulator [Thermoguttaceae bacterium]
MQIARILDLANRLEADIQSRRLRPGDPYLGTEQTARLLGVSSALANRALQLLVKRGILHRRQRRGTFIAKLPDQVRSAPLGRVHVLVHRDYMVSEGVLVDGVVVGMEGELTGAQMVFNFISTEGSQEIVHRLVAEALQSPEPEGFVLVRCPLGVQRLIQSSGLPAVIHGHPYPSVRGIPSLDWDQRETAELLVRYFLHKGCTRLVVLFRQQVLPGDHIVLDHIHRVLIEAGFGLGDLVVRCLPHEEPCVAEETVRLVEMGGDRPTGFFCRSEPLANGVAAGLARLGPDAPQVLIGVGSIYRKPGQQQPPYVHTRPILSPIEIGHRIGRLLAMQAQGQRPEPLYETLHMELVEPGPEVQTERITRWEPPHPPQQEPGAG